MSVRFVLGRAGSGKTHHCLEAVRSRLLEDRLNGNGVILLVPEQASLQMERELLEDPALGAHSRGEVLSFRRLALRVLSQAGGAGDRVLTPLGRIMVLRHLLDRQRSNLRCYGRVVNRSGFVSECVRAIIELMHERITPEALYETLKRMGPDAPSADKVHDLAIIYRAYCDYLSDGPADPERYLDLAAQRLSRCEWTRDCEVWVDGFAGFTRQESSLLVELARLAKRVEIAFLLDPDDVGEPAEQDPGPSFRLFSATERTYADLRRSVTAAGIDVDAPLCLKPNTPPRFSASPTLARLEQTAFSGQPGPTGESESCPGAEVCSFPDRRLEVEAALTRIQDLVRRRDDPLRYRDMAVIVRDLEPYHDLISAAAAERHIPVFVDRRQPVGHHSFVELLRALCMLGRQDFSRDAVSLLVKTGLWPVPDDRLDKLENYVRAYGITGATLWTGAEWGFWRKRREEDATQDVSARDREHLREVNRTRWELLHLLGDWVDLCARRVKQSGGQWVTALEKVLDSLHVEEHLERWAVEAEDDGRPAEAMEHRQVWSETLGVLEDLRQGLGDAELDIAQFSEVLNSGLSELTLGLTPPTLDQLLVGTIERSRHPSLKAVFLLGFNERVFPRVAAEHPILNDDDRDALAAASATVSGPPAVRLGQTRGQRLLEERFLSYVALTRASQSLWISYARSDEQGKELFPSPFVQSVQAALPQMRVTDVYDPEEARTPEFIGSGRMLAARLAGEMGSRPRREADSARLPARARWNRLYSECQKDDTLSTTLRQALSSLGYVNEAVLDDRAVELLYGRPIRNSVTRLETFANCPFRHFARYGLRLGEREEHRLEAIELGTISHAVIERFVRGLMPEAVAFHELDDATIEERLRRLAADAAAELHDELLLSEARNRYLIERCSRDLSRVLRGQRRWSGHAGFRPRAVELAFGLRVDDSLPTLVIHTPKGRRLELCGRIDRVDLAELERETLVAVIDYKRQRRRSLSLADVFHGLALQLVTYLLALQEHGESWLGRPVQPAGAFYLPLLNPHRSVAHPSEADDTEQDAGRASPVMRGLLNTGYFKAFDGRTTAGNSPVVSAFVKKDGSFGHVDSRDTADEAQFGAALAHVRERIAELGDRMFDGEVRVAPARLGKSIPCTWCEYRSVCRFDYRTTAPRTLEPLTRSEALERMRSPEHGILGKG